MRLDPSVQESEIDSWITSIAELTYGAERARELAYQIQSIAEAMAVIAQVQLEFSDSAPDNSGVGEDQP